MKYVKRNYEDDSTNNYNSSPPQVKKKIEKSKSCRHILALKDTLANKKFDPLRNDLKSMLSQMFQSKNCQ